MLHITFVQSEGKFINVAAKILRARMVIDTDEASFENRENALNSVGSHVIARELDVAAG